MDDNENSVTQDPGPFIDMVILANGKPMEEYEAAGAEARILCQTTTYIEDPSNRASEQPFEIEATIDPATRFMSDFIAFRILYNGKERDCRLIEEDECSDAPLVVTYSHDRQGDSYCIPNKYQCRDFVIQVHHSIKGKSMTMGPSGVAEWHGNRYLDEGVPAWEFVYKFRVRATLLQLIKKGLITAAGTSCAPEQDPQLECSADGIGHDEDGTPENEDGHEHGGEDGKEEYQELQGIWIDIHLDGTKITGRDVVESSRITTRSVAVTGGLLHVAMAVQRGAHFPTGSDVAVFMIFVDGTYTESAAIEQQSTVNSGAHELSTGYPTDLGHFTMSLRKDIMGADITQPPYPPGTIVVEVHYMKIEQPYDYRHLDELDRPAHTFVFNCIEQDRVTRGVP